MFRLLPFLLFLMLAAPVAADSVYQSGDAQGRLVGAFPNDLQGTFVQATWYPDGLSDVRIPGASISRIEAALDPARITGPMADMGAITLHDNLYGWIHVEGAARIATSGVTEVLRGLRSDEGWWLTAPDLTWSHTDGWLEVSASDFLISNNATFQALGPEPSAWALLQGGGGTVMDWFAFDDAPFKTKVIDDRVVMALVGTIGEGALDSLVRLETDGHFEPRADRFVFRFASQAAAPVTAGDLGLARGGFTFHARDVGHAVIDLRLPAGMSGDVRWRQDLVAPVLEEVLFNNIDPYAPLQAPPEMVSNWNEPVWASLQIGDYQKVATHAANQVRFRITGLAPETLHEYTLTARDLAGNIVQETGSFATGPMAGPAARINVTSVQTAGGVTTVGFEAFYDDGSIVPSGMVHVFIDKQASDERLARDGDAFVVDVPAGSKELRIEVQTPRGRISQVVELGGETQTTPLAWWLPLAALAMLRRR